MYTITSFMTEKMAAYEEANRNNNDRVYRAEKRLIHESNNN